MANPVFQGDPLDTPVNVPGWTVQSPDSGVDGGSDQEVTESPGVHIPFIAQLSLSATAADCATAIDALLTELINSGLMASS